MEKKPMYTVMTSTHHCKRQWVAWVAAGVSLVALLVAAVTAAVVSQQGDRVTHLEERLLEMESHIEELLGFMITSHDYLDYDDHVEDESEGPYGELTVHRVVRRRRQVNSVEPDDPSSVPIYDQAYGVDLKARSTSEGLRLYESLMATRGEGDPTSPEVTMEATESPIKPHHRVSNLWVPTKRRQKYPTRPSGPNHLSSRALVRQDDDEDDEADGASILGRGTFRHHPILQRPSRTKSFHGSRRGVKRRRKHRAKANTNPRNVIFRDSFVKATSRHDGYSGPNSVVPQVPEVPQLPLQVNQGPLTYLRGNIRTAFTERPTTNVIGKRRRQRKKPNRKKRRPRPVITLAHFGASSANRTSRHGYPGAEEHKSWTPAAWMDKLGLNRKYSLDRGIVTVKESGLYYLYAQVLYEAGRFSSGFQILVDNIPILECSLTPSQPSPSCHTSGLTYLPKNAQVRVRELDRHSASVHRQQNTFFGMVKLMDAPETAEELLLA